MKDGADPGRKAALEKDIAELDGLIEQILLSSRLEASKAVETPEDIDLLALAAEEGGPLRALLRHRHLPLSSAGNRGLLQRMVRNLLDNAERHGAPPIGGRCGTSGGQRRISVTDHGAGVEIQDRERIFTPFYRAAGTQRSGCRAGPCPRPADCPTARRRRCLG